MDAQTVGKKIKQLRNSRSMTQQQLADELCVTNKAVSKWETGGGLPDIALLPALASALGVTVEDIISDNGLQVSKTLTRAKRIGYVNNKRNIKFVVIPVFILLLIFGMYNLIWFRYISIAYTPFIENGTWITAGLKVEGGLDSNIVENRVWIIYEHWSEENDYIIGIGRPSYLRFGGVINVTLFADPEPDVFYASFDITHKGRIFNIQQEFKLTIGELGMHRSLFSLTVDRYGEPPGRQPGDSEEYYEMWLSLHEKHYGEIMAMLAYFNDFFGDGVFR